MATSARKRKFAVCLSNEGYRASLEPRKIYAVVEDTDAAKHGLLRVIDETGESYLYPKARFAPIKLPPEVERVISAQA
jgi:hypothetical protein